MSLAIGNAGLQDESLYREEARIRRKWQQMEERKKRFLNVRKRTIGMDVEALDRQVEEMRQTRHNKNEDNKMDRLRYLEIDRVLEVQEEEQKNLRKYQMDEMKKSWDWSTHHKNNPPPIKTFTVDEMGLSAAQKFNGEDPNFRVRSSAQKEQMRKWIQEQVAQKAFRSSLDIAEKDSQLSMLKAIDTIRVSQEKEEDEMKKFLRLSVREENRLLAEAQAEKRSKENNFWKVPEPPVSSVVAEDAQRDSDGYVKKSKDAFKGYSAEQNRKFLQENEEIIARKKVIDEAAKLKEYDWMMQQLCVQRAMEQAAVEERNARKQNQKEHLAYLRYQIAEQKQNQHEWNSARMGTVNDQFFSAFGTSAR
jgi:hypothetical protein